MALDFYVCAHCGNIITFEKNTGVPVKCCGENMQKLAPNTTDAATEKHVPVITTDGNTVTVTVGSTLHPMLEAHYIEWIILETEKGVQKKTLAPGEEPVAVFALTDDDKPVAAYEYCNLHGLWAAKADK